MNDITLCTMHTEKPYYIKEINKNIYSIEELSYYLFNYLYLIDDQFFSEGLIDYIENELKQPHIASGIRQINANKGALGEKISFLIKNAGYYTEREAEKLENHLVMLSSKTAAERIKAKADILMETDKYNMAINYYNSILKHFTLLSYNDYKATFSNGVNLLCFSDVSKCNGKGSYLYSGYNEWLLGDKGKTYYIDDTGRVLTDNTLEKRYFRPVLYLKDNVLIAGGDGTIDFPYFVN